MLSVFTLVTTLISFSLDFLTGQTAGSKGADVGATMGCWSTGDAINVARESSEEQCHKQVLPRTYFNIMANIIRDAVGAALWVKSLCLIRIYPTDSGFSLYSSTVTGMTNKSEIGLQIMKMPGAARCRNSLTSTGVNTTPTLPLRSLMGIFQCPTQAR
jgi:hypothetical protein